jgi:hypothetical protein
MSVLMSLSTYTHTQGVTMYNAVEIPFTIEKETKNCVRFTELVGDDESPYIRTLYITKELHAEIGTPDEITVTVAAA